MNHAEKWAEQAAFVDRKPADVRSDGAITAALRASYIGCHALGLGVVGGGTCLDCEHFGGLRKVANIKQALRRFRGVCFAPTPRAVLRLDGRPYVRCPIAPAYVDGAERNDAIRINHCLGCEFYAGGQVRRPSLWRRLLGEKRAAVAVLCRAHKSITYQAAHTEAES